MSDPRDIPWTAAVITVFVVAVVFMVGAAVAQHGVVALAYAAGVIVLLGLVYAAVFAILLRLRYHG